MLNPERSISVNIDHVFYWDSPNPLDQSVTPTLQINFRALSAIYNFAPLHAEVAVDDISTDRRVLTAPLMTILGSKGMQGEYGSAWLINEENGAFPVVIGRVTDGYVHLTEPLPKNITGVGKLQWSRYYLTIPSLALTEIERGISYTINYTTQYGVDLSAQKQKTEGLLNVVRQPFDTGLTTTLLVSYVPELATLVPRNAQDFAGIIAMGRLSIISEIRALLSELDLTEDDIYGPTVQQSHVYFSLYNFYLLKDFEKAQNLLSFAQENLKTSLKRIWVDKNKDGVVDTGEENLHITGGNSDDCGGYYTTEQDFSFDLNTLDK